MYSRLKLDFTGIIHCSQLNEIEINVTFASQLKMNIHMRKLYFPYNFTLTFGKTDLRIVLRVIIMHMDLSICNHASKLIEGKQDCRVSCAREYKAHLF